MALQLPLLEVVCFHCEAAALTRLSTFLVGGLLTLRLPLHDGHLRAFWPQRAYIFRAMRTAHCHFNEVV